MQKAVSTYVYVKERLHPGLLDALVRGGAQAIEIFAARQHLDYANRKQHVREIADWFRSTGIPLNSVHSPLYGDYEFGRAGAPPVNVASTDRAGRIEAMDEIKRALEIAEQIPFRFLVQHLGTNNESFDERKLEAAMTSVEHLRAFGVQAERAFALLDRQRPHDRFSCDRRISAGVRRRCFDRCLERTVPSRRGILPVAAATAGERT